MSRTVRRRKQTDFLFANSYTNRFKKADPQSRKEWSYVRRIHADGCGNFWLRDLPSQERASGHKKNRKLAKLAMKSACKSQDRDMLVEVNDYHFTKRSRY